MDFLVAVICLILGIAVITWYMMIFKPKEEDKLKKSMEEWSQLDKELVERRHQEYLIQEETIASYLNIPSINIIVREHSKYGFHKVKANDKSYTVKFNSDFTEVEKIVEGTLI